MVVMVDMGGCWPTCGGGGGGGERERGGRGGKRERKRGKEKERLMFVYRNKQCIVDRVISNATLISNVVWLRKRAQNFLSPNFCHTRCPLLPHLISHRYHASTHPRTRHRQGKYHLTGHK